MNKRDIIILLIVIVVLAGILIILPFRMMQKPAPQSAITNVDTSRLPDSFPANVPIDAVIKIESNFNATGSDGRVQATRTVVSSRSVDGNFAFYKTFITASGSGWTLVNEVNDPASPNHKALFARNTDGIMSINISAGKTPGTSILDVSFTAFKPK